MLCDKEGEKRREEKRKRKERTRKFSLQLQNILNEKHESRRQRKIPGGLIRS